MRAVSLDPRTPSVLRHLRWMWCWLRNPNRQAWVVKVGDGSRAGLLRLSKGDGKTVIGIAVAPGHRRQGIATHAIMWGTGWARCEPGWDLPTAYIKKSNEVSVRTFRKAGYSVEHEGDELVIMRPDL